MTIDAGRDVTVEGNVPVNASGGDTLAAISEVSAASLLGITAGQDITIARSGELNATASSGQVALDAGRDSTLAGEIFADESVTVTADGDVTLSNRVTASTTIDITAGDDGTGSILGDIGADLTLIGDDGDSGTTDDVVNDEILLTAGVASGNITLDASGIATENRVILTAAGGAITHTQSALIANTLVADAATGITANTRVSSIDAQLTGTGDIDIENVQATDGSAIDLTLTSVITADGQIDIRAQGNITATYVETQGSSDANDIMLTPYPVDDVPSNLSYTDIRAGGSGDVDLVVDGDVIEVATSGQSDPRILGDHLTVTGIHGLDLSTGVNSIAASTSDTGDIVIEETDGIDLIDVAVLEGSLRVTTGSGVLTATNARVLSNEDSADIELTSGGAIAVGLVDAGIYAADTNEADDIRLDYFNAALRTIGYLAGTDEDWSSGEALAFNNTHPGLHTDSRRLDR